MLGTIDMVEEQKMAGRKRYVPTRKNSPSTLASQTVPTQDIVDGSPTKKPRGRPPGRGKYKLRGSARLDSDPLLSKLRPEDVSLSSVKGRVNTPAIGGEEAVGALKRDEAVEKEMIEEAEMPVKALLPLSTDKEKVEIDGLLLSKKYLPLYKQLCEKHGSIASDSALVDPVVQGNLVKRLLQTIVEMNQLLGRVSDDYWKKWEQSLVSAENVKFNVAWLRGLLTTVKAQHDTSMHSVNAKRDGIMAAKDAAQNQMSIAQRAVDEADMALRVFESEVSELGAVPLAEASLFLD